MGRPVLAVGVVAVILLLGDVLALATVGGGAGNQSGVVQTLTSAQAVTLAAKTARFSATVETTVDLGTRPETVKETQTGLIDFAHTAEQLSIVSDGVKSELRLVNGVTYLQEPPAIAAQLHVKTPWVSFPAVATKAGGGDPTGTMGSLLGSLGSTATHAKRSGTLVIGGTPTTAYALELKPSVVNQLASAASTRIVAAGATSTHISSLAVSVWVDGRGLIRRIDNVIRSTVTVAGDKLDEVSTTSALFSDFGVAVHVSAPPANQVSASSTPGAVVPAGG